MLKIIARVTQIKVQIADSFVLIAWTFLLNIPKSIDKTKKYKSKSLITIKDEKISYDISDDLCDDISYDISDDISDDVHNDVYNDVYNFSDKSSVKQIPNFKSRFENTPFECLTITISNDINKKRIFSYSSSSNISPCIKLRSGRIINKI